MTQTRDLVKDEVGVLSLKSIIRKFNKAHMSYATICALIPDLHGWNENSLKQFLSRSGSARISAKLIALASTIIEIGETNMKRSFLNDPDYSSELMAIRHLVASISEKDHLDSDTPVDVQLKLQSIMRKGSNISLPKRSAFVRYGLKKEQIIVMEVSTFLGQSGYIFAIKCVGSNDFRTITVGEVLHTFVNTYFCGITYNVKSTHTSAEFEQMNPLSALDFDKTVSMNETGMEFIALPNSRIADDVMPVTFTGVSGSGTPVSGTGILLDDKAIEALGISDQTIVCFKTEDAPKSLSNILHKYSADTQMLDSIRRVPLPHDS